MLVILTKDIRFKDFDDQWVHLKEGEELYVDLEEGIGFTGEYHFDIAKSEYIVIN